MSTGRQEKRQEEERREKGSGGSLRALVYERMSDPNEQTKASVEREVDRGAKEGVQGAERASAQLDGQSPIGVATPLFVRHILLASVLVCACVLA